jgi:hypothetical protein
MNPVAKLLIGLGTALILGGLIWQVSSRMGLDLGKLPGDIAIEKPGFKIYFPIATCVLISVVISFVLWLVRVLSGR